jgi:hypothetical protein
MEHRREGASETLRMPLEASWFSPVSKTRKARSERRPLHSRRIPEGWLKISNSEPRATPISVMPQAWAVLTASAVGAEMATMKQEPIAAAF